MMTLYSCSYCPYSHRCRILLCEKEIEAQIVDVDLSRKPAELAQFNPYNQVPVLVDKELVLHESNIINEYLNERFPHPELLPTDIIQKARVRLWMLGFERELYANLDTVLRSKSDGKVAKARSEIVSALLQISNDLRVADRKYLMGPEFTLGDVALAPLLWRLQHAKIRLPKRALPLLKYAQRVFARDGFIRSLTAVEKVMRD